MRFQQFNMNGYQFLIAVLILSSGCKGDGINQYKQLVDHQLSRNIQFNDLFYGIKLGMTKAEFFTHCRTMNKNGLFFNSAGNTAVICRLDTGLKSPAKISFFPEFFESRMYKLSAAVSYESFAPWNKSLFADSLATNLMRLFQDWYGTSNVLQIRDRLNGTSYIKIDGNRKLTIRKKDEQEVNVEFIDLLVEKKSLQTPQ